MTARPPLRAGLRAADDGSLELTSPMVGYYRDAPPRDRPIVPGTPIGMLEVLGERLPIEAPEGAVGVVLARGAEPSRLGLRPVAFGEALFALDPNRANERSDGNGPAVEACSEGTVFLAPMAGRYYARPAPDKAPFIEAGAVVDVGTTVALLEIMKTFNRLHYGGPDLPPRCRVVEILVRDGDDIEVGQPIFRFEAA